MVKVFVLIRLTFTELFVPQVLTCRAGPELMGPANTCGSMFPTYPSSPGSPPAPYLAPRGLRAAGGGGVEAVARSGVVVGRAVGVGVGVAGGLAGGAARVGRVGVPWVWGHLASTSGQTGNTNHKP